MIYYECDGCKKKVPAEKFEGRLFKPNDWFERGDEDGTQHACSRDCIEKIAEETGKTKVVLPF